MKQTKINFNLDGLEEIQKQVKCYKARVGILGSDINRQDANGITNSEIGVVHEFGNDKVPVRSFLRMPIMTHKKEILKEMGGTKIRTAFAQKDYMRMFKLLGEKGRDIVLQAFETGGFGQWPDIAQSTKDAKGSSGILLDTLQLKNAISADVVKS